MEARLASLERMEITSMGKWIRHEYDYTTALHDFISQMSIVSSRNKDECTQSGTHGGSTMTIWRYVDDSNRWDWRRNE